MEENKIRNQSNTLAISILHNNFNDSLPKCLSKSKIKEMKGKIFWLRNSS